MPTPARKSDRRTSKGGTGGDPKTPGRSSGGSGGGPQYEWAGKHYTAMTELLRAIQKDTPGHPDDYYQGIFENNYKLTAVQVSSSIFYVTYLIIIILCSSTNCT